MDEGAQKSVLRTLATSNTLSMTPNVPTVGRVSSPMTNLTLNLRELSTGRCVPCRKLSMNNVEPGQTKPSADRSVSILSSKPAVDRSISVESAESGCFVDTPSPLESPTFNFRYRFGDHANTELWNDDLIKRKTVPLRRFNSMPVPPMLSFSPEEPDPDPDPLPEHLTRMFTRESVTEDVDEGTHDVDYDKNLWSSTDDRPTFFIEENSSQDSGLGCERDVKDLDGMFAAPRGMPPLTRRHTVSAVIVEEEDTCSPFKYSPVKTVSPSKRRNSATVGGLDFSGEIVPMKKDDDLDDEVDENDSPLKTCSLTSADEGIDAGIDAGDGFLELIDSEAARMKRATCAMSNLFTAPVVRRKPPLSTRVMNHQTSNTTDGFPDEDDTPVTRRVACRRFLRRSQSVDIRSSMLSSASEGASPVFLSYKRDQPEDEEDTLEQDVKRRRPASVVESPTCVMQRPKLHRCHSMSEAMIKSALNRQADEPDLIGDCSKTYCLPTIRGSKHQDLKCISGATLCDVLDEKYAHVIEQMIVVDCRYPYEFDGGHIQTAENLYTVEHIVSRFLKHPIKALDPNKRVILVFHCEFSSERGPRLSRFLRKQDRQKNKECYPYLHYPEIYLLDGGYKVFYESEKDHCAPVSYTPMLHEDHGEDLRHFRTKSKSWAGEKLTRSGLRAFKL